MFITDVVIISITIISSFLGWSKGFVKEFLSLSKWLISSYIAFISFEKTKLLLSNYFKDSLILEVVAASSIFILVFIILSMIVNFLSKIISLGSLGLIDKILGFIFGFIRILLIFSLLIILYESIFLNSDQPQWMIESFLIDHIKNITNFFQNKFLEFNLNDNIISRN